MTTSKLRPQGFLDKVWIPYVAPFVIYLLLTEAARHVPALSPHLYIVKTVVAGLLLWNWRPRYSQDLAPRLTLVELFEAIVCGLLVLVIWVAPEDYLFKVGESTPFNPQALGESTTAVVAFIGVRLIGSSLVVPLMEELFWRSFLMRYLINPEFKNVSIGAFSWLSFLATALFFGLEHHRVVVGVIAGLLYGLLLLRQKKLWGVIIAHMVTNLGLGIYIITTKNWIFW